jgi:threonine dehydratase
MKYLILTTMIIAAASCNLVNIERDLSVKAFYQARQNLQGIAYQTPLMYMSRLSEKYDCNVFVKREDLQVVRSYKIRGAFNKMSNTPMNILKKGVVCASAGNHAQGVAFSCARLKIYCKVFMPLTAPPQKINKVKGFGREYIEVILTGKNFDEALAAAEQYTKQNGSTFVSAFNDLQVITGQGTVGLEIIEDIDLPIDYVFAGIGGGGFLSGLSAVFKQLSPET